MSSPQESDEVYTNNLFTLCMNVHGCLVYLPLDGMLLVGKGNDTQHSDIWPRSLTELYSCFFLKMGLVKKRLPFIAS